MRPPCRSMGDGTRPRRRSSTMKPLASASARPAHRSASSAPAPVRGPLTERGAGRLVSTSKAAATAASWSDVSGRSASEMSRRTRRHSCDRIASRAMTRSSNDPVSDALGSSRRAASSSSATSGEPPDRSATSRSRLADARSPSIPSIRAASSSRSSGGMTSRRGGCGPVTIASRSADHGSYRATTSDCAVPTMTRRWSRATRARNVTTARVAASARCRSSTTKTTGWRSPSRPSRPRMPSSVRAWRRSGAVVPRPPVEAPIASRRGARSGNRRTTSEVAGPSRSARIPSGSARSVGPMARTIGP